MISLIFLTFSLGLSHAAFEPILNVESCTKSQLTVSTFGANDGGLIFIQGQGESCKQPTSSGLALYDFDFTACGIQWEMLFKIVIQKSSAYQTGADKVIPIFCIADTSDLIVSNSNSADKTDDSSMNMTVKPSAAMRFYKVVSEEEVSGTEVKLSDVLIMTLELADDFTVDFDIKARYCIASDLVIISDFCSTDTDLFPNFSRFKRGYLMSEFGAFRPTTIEGGEVQMNFSCVLTVCQDDCEETNCNGESGWGRKKRDIGSARLAEISPIVTEESSVRQAVDSTHFIEKRQADNFDIDVGGKVKIVEKYSEIQIVTKETMCMNAALLIFLMLFLGAGFVTFGVTTIIFYRKLNSAQSQALPQKKTITRDGSIGSTSSLHQLNFGKGYANHF